MFRPLIATVTILALFFPEHDPAYTSWGQEVGPFTLPERSGKPVAPADLLGKVWVAHFFYSQCQGPCNKTLPAMRELQQRFSGKPDVMLVSISVDPTDDTPALLTRYAEDQG